MESEYIDQFLKPVLNEEEEEEELERKEQTDREAYSEVARKIVDETIERAAKHIIDVHAHHVQVKKQCSQSDLNSYLWKSIHGEWTDSIVGTVKEEVKGEGGVQGGAGEQWEGDESSDNIRWPTCEEFSAEVGEEKIRELIKTWEYTASWLYHITLLSVDDLQYDTRYHYKVMWSIPTRRLPIPRATASVYFTIDVSKVKPPGYTSVQVYYVFEGSRLVHRPGQTTFREQWLRDIIANKVKILEHIDF